MFCKKKIIFFREFGIVILNAICSASEAACYVAGMETSVLNNLVLFLELADTNMHQVSANFIIF